MQALSKQLLADIRRVNNTVTELHALLGRAPGAGLVPNPAPAPRETPIVKVKPLPLKTKLLVGASLGAAAWLLFSVLLPKKAPAAPTNQLPNTPPPTPPVRLDEIIVTAENPGPIAAWSSNKKTLNTLTGYHRAKTSEVGPEALARMPALLPQGKIGEVLFFEADGKKYAAAFEEHTNIPGTGLPGGKPHKGISVFVKDNS